MKQARALSNKQLIYFRHRDLGRKIIVDLETEKVDLGRQEQVSFETKEELLRLAHGILLKFSPFPNSNEAKSSQPAKVTNEKIMTPRLKAERDYEMCSKPVKGQTHVELIDKKPNNFDCKECALTFGKLKSVYGDEFQ